MAASGYYSALQLIAASGLLQGIGIGVNANLTLNLANFNGLPVVSQFNNVAAAAIGKLSSATIIGLRTMGQDFLPLTNAIPSAFVSALQPVAPSGVATGGFSGLIGNMATGIMGQGDLGRFVAIWDSATGFIGPTNTIINSALNATTYLGPTFGPKTGGMDNVITGSFNQVSEAFGALGTDLRQMGKLINMNNLANLGLPSALLQQVINVGGVAPTVNNLLKQAGITGEQITDIASGSLAGFADSVNKLLYQGMTKITGQELSQIKKILGVTTPNIDTMADLLNPLKIFPSSYTTLTTLTPDGLRGIYADANGTVNSNLQRYFIDPDTQVYAGDDPIIRARLGLAPVDGTRTATT